jgi:hypothetical protein
VSIHDGINVLVLVSSGLVTMKCMLAAQPDKEISLGYYAVLLRRCMFIYKAGVRELGSEPIGQGKGKAGQVGGWCGGRWEHFATIRMISTSIPALTLPLGRMVRKVFRSIPAFSECPNPGPKLSCQYSESFLGPIDPLPVGHLLFVFNTMCSKWLIYSRRFHL